MRKKNNTLIIILLVLLICSIIGIILLAIQKNPINTLPNKELIFNSMQVRSKYDKIVKYIGEPSFSEVDEIGIIRSVTWQSPLNEYNGSGKFGGLDYIKLSGYIAKKYHPIPASVFVIVGKYINVPDHLLGPIKYASETINIEQLFVPKVYNDAYVKQGKKKLP